MAPKCVVSAVPKKNLVIALPYLGNLSLQIRTRINRIKFSRLSARLVTFLHLKTKLHRSYVSALFTNFSIVTAMLPIMKNVRVILKSKCVNTWEFLHSLVRGLKVMMIMPLKNIFYSAITHLILKISKFLQPTTTTLKSCS